MGRRLPDGSIQFEGRKDFQIKIRGFRVELGEIESALTQHEFVREGVVVANENTSGEKRLVAYVVPKDKASSSFEGGSGLGASQTLSLSQSPKERGEQSYDLRAAELRDYLRQKLPEYMVPSSFVMLDALPLTASGKLNRLALPDPKDSVETVTPVAPRTPLEVSLTTIWADVLEVKAIGINENFFDLGGHSLLAVRLFAQIEKRLDKRLPLATLFQAPTVAELAAVMQKEQTTGWSSLIAINPIKREAQTTNAPFFCVHALGGNVLEYRELAQHLGENQPFYGLQSAGLDGARPPHTQVEDMAAHYIKEMRELQPNGPYFIGGRSLGGVVAFEMAQQLQDQGEQIGLLALLDTYPSGYAKLLRNEVSFAGTVKRGLRRTKSHLSNLGSLQAADKIIYVMKKARFAPRKAKSQIWRRVYQMYQSAGRSLPKTLRDIKEFNSLAVRNYVPKVYEGSVTLFWASADLRTSKDLVDGWRALAGGGMEVHEIPGTHLDIIKEPHVSHLATKLRSCLANAQANHRS
jgi:thioesterase domain-containing protein/acyl carrier protein